MGNTYYSKNGMVVLLIFCIFILGATFWVHFHNGITYYSFYIVWKLLSFLGSFSLSIRNEISALALKSNDVSFITYFLTLNKAGYFFILPTLLILLWGFLLTFKKKSFKSRKITPTSFPIITSKFASSIIPVLNYGDPKDLLLNIDPPEHASALTPVEFVKNFELLTRNDKNQPILNKTKAYNEFVKQLGNKLDINKLSIPEKAVFTIFATHIMKGSKQSQSVIDEFNKSCHSSGYPDKTLIKNYFKKIKNNAMNDKIISKLLEAHNYNRTLLFGMSVACREFGKLPSSTFRYIKSQDRALWYSLNNVGRKVAWIESAGVYSQFNWENFLYAQKSSYKSIFIDDAVNGLEKFLFKAGLIEKN